MLIQIWREFSCHMSRRRKYQLAGLCALMLMGALAELMTLGAVVPFLAIIADPERFAGFSWIKAAATRYGWSPQDLLYIASVLFIAVALASAAIRLLLNWVNFKFIFGLGHDIGVEVYQKILGQPYSWHVEQNSATSIATIGKVQMMVFNVLIPVLQGLIALVTGLFIFIGVFAISASAASIAVIGFAATYTIVSISVRRRVRRNGKLISDAQPVRIRMIQEGLGGIRDVILDGAQPYYTQRFSSLDSRMRSAQASIRFLSAAPRYFLEATAIVIIVGITLVLLAGDKGVVGALPTLGALALAGQKLIPIMQVLYRAWVATTSGRALMDDVFAALRLTVAESPAADEQMIFEKDIQLQKIQFSYSPEGQAILKDLDLIIPKGHRIGLVGETGSGKSTVADIIMGLLNPSGGRMLVDGVELTTQTRSLWRRRVAHVPQSIYLMDASIIENVAIGVPLRQISEQRVREVIALAALDEFIEALPAGLGTLMGERGVRLSGGQRQRIGIARALYKQPEVLVLDEATSALDDKTERAVVRNLEALSRQLTIITIAHRTTTLRGCDAVYEVVDGKILATAVPS